MPSWVDEKIWKKAKARFMNEYGHKPRRKSDWKIVMTIYEKMLR